MPVQIMNSDEARSRWRDILDAARGGSDTVIARYGKPAVAVIPIEDYEALRELLEELRVARQAQAALEAWRADPSRGIPYDQVRAELVAEGLLDE